MQQKLQLRWASKKYFIKKSMKSPEILEIWEEIPGKASVSGLFSYSNLSLNTVRYRLSPLNFVHCSNLNLYRKDVIYLRRSYTSSSYILRNDMKYKNSDGLVLLFEKLKIYKEDLP